MRHLRIFSLLILPALVPCQPAADPPVRPAEKSRYETRQDHDPNGIGKFYMGREIAQVMGHQAAGWLERPEREKEEQPTRMVEALKLRPGDVVADIGAGSGYLTFRMTDRIGPKGKVLAVDIQPEMLDLIRQGMKDRKITNVEPILGTETDPKLPANSVDLILMVDVYHEFSYPWEMTEAMVKGLKPGGRLIFVEFRKEDPEVPIKLVHKMTEQQVRKEMEPHPVHWVETIDVLPWQHIIIFKKNNPNDPVENAMREDRKKLEGSWTIVSREVDGEASAPASLKNQSVMIAGNDYIRSRGQSALHGAFTLNVGKQPKQINLRFRDGADKGKLLQGIYELDDEKVRICLAPAGKSRPTEFVSNPGSGHVLEVLKRDKP
jgi:uncharacterized protein (TIGR03067 family)